MHRTVNTVWIVLSLSLVVASHVLAQTDCRRVLVDGLGIHACVSGNGPETVVLAAGAGQTSGTWNGLRSELSRSARVITFDRPGLGQSDPGVQPRTPTRIARELHVLLQTLGVDGAVVLVGHSIGGLHVLRYASLFPDQVQGVAILDTPPAGFESARRNLLTAEERSERERLLEEGSVRGPPVVRQERQGAEARREWDFPTFPRKVPLVVMVANAQNFGDLGSTTAHRDLWKLMSREWAELSKYPEFVVAEGSGHMIHHDRRDLVIESIQRLLRRTR